MNEILSQVLSYVPAMWRSRWLMAGVAWAVCLIGWTFVAFMPDRYESSARVYVDTESVLGPLLGDMVIRSNVMHEVSLMQRTLKSRPNLEKVARMADLDLSVEKQEDMEKLITKLSKDITVSGSRGGPNLFSIKYAHVEPRTAQKVVQSLFTLFVEGHIKAGRTDIDSAQQFLDDQLRKYEQEMNEAEQRLAEFKHKNIGLLPGNIGYYESLAASRAELATMEAQLEDAESLVAELNRQLNTVPQFIEYNAPGALGSGPPSGVEVRILELETAIENMLLQYTEQHPDVVTARTRLEALREQWREETEAGYGPGLDDSMGIEEDIGVGNVDNSVERVSIDDAESTPDSQYGPGASSPVGGATGGTSNEVLPNQVYNQIKMQLVSAEAETATLRTRISRQQARVDRLDGQANLIPQVEQELKKLTRDYGVIRKNYEKLLASKETAEISESRDTEGEKVQFRIIEPPRLPLLPTGVKRSLYLTVVLIAGVGAALGFGVLIAGTQTTFFGTQRLMQVISLPVLGTVSMISKPGRRSWRSLRLASFSVAVLAILGTYGGLMAVESRVGLPNAVPSDLRQQIVEKLPAKLTEDLK